MGRMLNTSRRAKQASSSKPRPRLRKAEQRWARGQKGKGRVKQPRARNLHLCESPHGSTRIARQGRSRQRFTRHGLLSYRKRKPLPLKASGWYSMTRYTGYHRKLFVSIHSTGLEFQTCILNTDIELFRRTLTREYAQRDYCLCLHTVASG